MSEFMQWLTCSNSELYDLGLDPKDRVSMSGHVRALSAAWASTVGMWGGPRLARDILERAETSRVTYNAFRHRHKLRTAANTDCSVGWLLSCTAYQHMAELPKVSGVSDGVRANALSRQYKSGVRDNLGILPSEILIRYESFAEMLDETGLSVEQFMGEEIDNETRTLTYARYDRFITYGLR